jgi:hypothetical protein
MRCRSVGRIADTEVRVQQRRRPALRRRAHGTADRLRDRRNVGQPLRQRPEIEAGAAGDDRQQTAGPRFREGAAERLHVAADRKILGRVGEAIEPVRHRLLLALGGAGGEHPEIAVDLHGIGVDHHAADTAGEVEGQRRLARCGRACDEDGIRASHVVALPCTVRAVGCHCHETCLR